jgi:glycosyltransferase involved in cell wall biosynthesis
VKELDKDFDDTHIGPTFSIVVNCRNGERYLREALDSIYSQSFEDWEIIFYDNGSTDSSLEIAKSFDSRLQVHQASQPTNLGEARMNAVDKCMGKYLCFLDVDDVFSPEKLRVQFDVFNMKNVVMISGGIDVIDENSRQIKTILPLISGDDMFASLLKNYQIFMPTVAIDLQYMRSKQLNFDKSMSYCPDYKLFMTIAQGNNICLLPSVLCKYRVHANSLSNATRFHTAGEEAMRSIKYFRSCVSGMGWNAKLAKAFNYAEANANFSMARGALEQGNRVKALGLLLAGPAIPIRSMLLTLATLMPLPTRVIKKILYLAAK